MVLKIGYNKFAASRIGLRWRATRVALQYINTDLKKPPSAFANTTFRRSR